VANNYAHPEVLMDTEWAAQHLKDPKVRFVEVDVDVAAYQSGHIPGAVGWHWKDELETPIRRNVASREQIGDLLSRTGIGPDTTVVLYGDSSNWFAAYAFWLLKYHGHHDVRLLNGGRQKWQAEGRPTATERPTYARVVYSVNGPDPSIRALRDFILPRVSQPGVALVDVRSPKEYKGELLAPEHLPQEGAQRGGHIPGAKNIVWSEAVREDGTFKSADELQALYAGQGVTPDKEVIAYCRIGERSSHTWFVLKYLLGYPQVRNYDGSWTEWGSLIDAPIER
jgi:thiosulfate/3-mercaptopyruvate sulfurtransferase